MLLSVTPLRVGIALLLLSASALYTNSSAATVPKVEGIQPQLLQVPDGFNISLWASELPAARQMASVKVGNATIVYVGSVGKPTSDVYYIVDRDSDGKPDFQGTLVPDIDTPNGVVIRGNNLYVPGFKGGKGMIWRLRDVHKYALQNKAFNGTLEVVTDKLPGVNNHGRRFLQFSPDGLLVLGIGEPCNVCAPSAADGIWFGSLYALNVTSGNLTQLAAGVRNSGGFDFHPETGDLYFTDNGRDQMGDDSPDCELNRLPQRPRATLASNIAAFDGPSGVPNFGFPYCQTQGLGNPYQRDLGGGKPINDPDYNAAGGVLNCSAPGAYIQAVQAMGPHTAPLGMRFYRWSNSSGASFPRAYNNTMFIVQRGSWNRRRRIGYRVMLLELDPVSQAPRRFEEFARGWLQNENTPQDFAWGRPNDVEQLPDGSLLVSDDDNGAIYRITYTGPRDTVTRTNSTSMDEPMGLALRAESLLNSGESNSQTNNGGAVSGRLAGVLGVLLPLSGVAVLLLPEIQGL